MKNAKRSKQRGAAMIEGIVVMTVMLVFLGMMTWAERAYAAKIDQMSATRSDVLFWASHSCETAPPADDPATVPAFGAESDTPIATADADTTTADSVSAQLPSDNGGAAELVRHWNMASTERATDVEGSAIVNLEKQKLSTHVHTQSWVACNEKSYGGDYKALAEFLWALPKNGAGLLGK